MKERFESITTTIMEFNRYLQKIKDIEMKKFGLRASHAMVLYYLGQYAEGLTSAELTKMCKADKAAISRCIAQLSEKELITCDRDDTKRIYRTRHVLTEEGKKVARQVNDTVLEAVNYGGKGLSDTERENFYRSCELIRSNMEQYIAAQEQGKD